MSNKHVNSHKVKIHVAGTFLSRAQTATNPGYYATAKESIGSYFKNGRTATGLSLEEEKILMPHVIDTEITDRDYRKKVTEFFSDITTPISYDTGVELEIGLTVDNGQPVSASNLPLEILEYIKYKHAIGHPWMALTKEEGIGNQLKKYYLFDAEAAKGKNQKLRKESDAAMGIYLKVKAVPESIDQMLTLLGVDIRNYVDDKNATNNKVEKLHELMVADPVNFTGKYNDGNIAVRAWIEGMITTGVLKQYGKRIIDPEAEEANKEIAASMEEAIFFFENEDNSAIVTALKARQQEANNTALAATVKRTILNK